MFNRPSEASELTAGGLEGAPNGVGAKARKNLNFRGPGEVRGDVRYKYYSLLKLLKLLKERFITPECMKSKFL